MPGLLGAIAKLLSSLRGRNVYLSIGKECTSSQPAFD